MVIQNKTLKISQIKKEVGDAWALIYNPEFTNDNKLLSGVLIYFNKSKEKVYEILKKDKAKNKNFAVMYMGKIPSNEVYVL